jgi:DNA-binding LytR/AlgR family response regulator
MSELITYIVVDDDILSIMAVEQLAAAFPGLQHKGSYTRSSEGLAAIEAIKPSLVFLDIEMPGITGLDIMRKIKTVVPMAVFITSHPEFALEGFELSALDYLMKPLNRERFAQCISRILEYWDMKNKALLFEVAFEKDSLTIKEGHGKIRLRRSEIIYLEAMQDYTKIVTLSKNYMTLSTLSNFLEQFSDQDLIRIHRSYAVASDKISALRSTEIVCDKYTLPIGKTYRQAVSQLKI